ncbi:hypothetical protein SRABI06_02044 [Pseudomonas brassicacearum]|nr:hypothetical protein SRABI06_02044 [Pseudomonas brassicacearum]
MSCIDHNIWICLNSPVGASLLAMGLVSRHIPQTKPHKKGRTHQGSPFLHAL